MVIQIATEHDVTALAQLAKLAMPFAWDESIFKDCFSAGYFTWIIKKQKDLIAFLVAFIYDDECQLMNMAVHPHYQHQGYGQALLSYLISHCKTQPIRRILLEVRASNQQAINFYQRAHFTIINIRKNYYPLSDGREDALQMEKFMLQD